MIRIILIFGLITLIEIYALKGFKMLCPNKIARIFWIVLSNAVYVFFFYLSFQSNMRQSVLWQYSMGVMITFFIPKVVVALFLLGEDFYRWGVQLFNFLNGNPTPIEGRRKFLTVIGWTLGSIPFGAFLYGIFKGKYDYRVLKYTLEFPDLPPAFDGLTITQISDIHSGSFTNREKIKYGVELINAQKSDLILFTGDIVNNFANEMNEWIPLFKTLKAPMGKYSILGNHDYGLYAQWKNEGDKAKNFEAIKNLHPKIGFELLLNQHRCLEKEGEKIALIGVENWGKSFHKAGDLKKASEGLEKNDFKILMSHDPSYWEYEVKNHPLHFQLTLSGHTHGFQMGIEIPGLIKWSPAQYMYKQWAGVYKHLGRYINVNRGFGYHAFPGRVGMPPEISVITLKQS